MNIITISSPHAHDHSSVSRLMFHVCLALVPCTLYGLYSFGFPAINLFVITIVSGIFWEALCLKMLKKPLNFLNDYSALLTSWLLALTLPPWAPWWIGVGGSFIAIVVTKHIYGGVGQNVFNPAMVARVALLISFPVHMTTWPIAGNDPFAISFLDSLAITLGVSPIPDAYTGATALGAIKTGLSVGATANDLVSDHFVFTDALMGKMSGSLGETSALLIFVGGLWLLSMRVISWHIPVSMLLTMSALTLLFHLIDPTLYSMTSFHLLSGGIMLGAFFIATDPVTSPSSKGGQLFFGAGCGVIDFLIRTWGGFPEGIGFAVLFMNALTPLIDLYFRPRIYGRRIDGSPKQYDTVEPAQEGKQT